MLALLAQLLALVFQGLHLFLSLVVRRKAVLDRQNLKALSFSYFQRVKLTSEYLVSKFDSSIHPLHYQM
jgi:hypothetical protein